MIIITGIIITDPQRLQELITNPRSRKELYNRAYLEGIIVTEEVYQELRRSLLPPPGLVWRKIPFGILLPPGLVKVKLVKMPSTIPKYKDTDLEKKFEWILINLGFMEGRDYKKQYRVSVWILDFAFPDLKVAFEPGATFYHTPSGHGKPSKPFGLSPGEVYDPPLEKDIEKNEMLRKEGWVIGWLNEEFVKHIPEVKGWIRRLIECAQGRGSLPSDEYFEEYDVIHQENYHIKIERKNPVTLAHSANQQIRKYMEQAASAMIVLKCFPRKSQANRIKRFENVILVDRKKENYLNQMLLKEGYAEISDYM